MFDSETARFASAGETFKATTAPLLRHFGVGREDAKSHPYLEGLYAPTMIENVEAVALNIVGELPREIRGSYFRNGPNAQFPTFRRHHWFDGDGMIHKITLDDGKATYQNRWVVTKAIAKERRAGSKLFAGIMEIHGAKVGSGRGILNQAAGALLKGKLVAQNALSQISLSDGPRAEGLMKDTANTDLIFFRGKIIPLWWLSGAPYTIDPKTLETTGIETFEGTYSGGVSAHARIDERTGDLFFLNFGQLRKFVSVNRVAANGHLVWSEKFSLPYPRIYHDLLFTEDYVVLLDFPLGFMPDPKTGMPELQFDRGSKNGHSRIVLIDRKNPKVQKTFIFPATYVLHGLNAFQKNGQVHVFVTKYEDPLINSRNRDSRIPTVGTLRVKTVTAHWKLDLASETLTENVLDDQNTEFARINDSYLGKPNHFSYHPRLVASSEVLFDGLVKYDLQSGAKEELTFGRDLVGEEAVFIPRERAVVEDDGWIATLVHNRASLECEYRLYDARSMDREPVARVLIPRELRVPYGFHAKWVSGEV